jgi:hypothetical protein
MDLPLSLTLFHYNLSADLSNVSLLEIGKVEEVFDFLKMHPLFNWSINHNFCDARAEAVSLVLTSAKIPHAKAWVMGAPFLQKGGVGGLKHYWNYHVAIALPVLVKQNLAWMVVDPSTQEAPVLLSDWAASITDYPHSYHFIKPAELFIFPEKRPAFNRWVKRSNRNFKWTMQGMLGIHALNQIGKAKLVFQKKRIQAFTKLFREELRNGGGFGRVLGGA